VLLFGHDLTGARVRHSMAGSLMALRYGAETATCPTRRVRARSICPRASASPRPSIISRNSIPTGGSRPDAHVELARGANERDFSCGLLRSADVAMRYLFVLDQLYGRAISALLPARCGYSMTVP
jgi:hypothetical protein